jgi:hypothetical protein
MSLWPILFQVVLASSPLALSDGRVPYQQILDGDSTALWRSSSPNFRKQFRKEKDVRAFSRRLLDAFGSEVRVISEKIQVKGASTVFERTAAFSHWARGVTVEITFDSLGRVDRLSARPASSAAPSAYEGYQVKTPLQLPFEGDWKVLWGGHTYELNRHSAVSDQRYALDLYIVRAGHSFRGRARSNSDFWCFEKPVYAPGDGAVVVARDGIEDNTPTRIQRGSLYGNHIVIDHENGEFSLLAHLRRGSLKVRPGQRVRAGTLIALTGSSGMSSEPHLHYQLMDHPDWTQAHGLPAVFLNYIKSGEEVDLGEPIKGDILTPMPSLGVE